MYQRKPEFLNDVNPNEKPQMLHEILTCDLCRELVKRRGVRDVWIDIDAENTTVDVHEGFGHVLIVID